MSFHIGFSLTRVFTIATEKDTIFTVQVVIQEVVKVLALSRNPSYENMYSFISERSHWQSWMFLLHMHSVGTPTGTHIVAHMALDLLVSLRNVLWLNMSLDILAISARVFTEAARKQSLSMEAEIGIEDIIQLSVSISKTCRMNRLLDISPGGSFLKAEYHKGLSLQQTPIHVFFIGSDVF